MKLLKSKYSLIIKLSRVDYTFTWVSIRFTILCTCCNMSVPITLPASCLPVLWTTTYRHSSKFNASLTNLHTLTDTSTQPSPTQSQPTRRRRYNFHTCRKFLTQPCETAHRIDRECSVPSALVFMNTSVSAHTSGKSWWACFFFFYFKLSNNPWKTHSSFEQFKNYNCIHHIVFFFSNFCC